MKLNVTELRDGITSSHGIHVKTEYFELLHLYTADKKKVTPVLRQTGYSKQQQKYLVCDISSNHGNRCNLESNLKLYYCWNKTTHHCLLCIFGGVSFFFLSSVCTSTPLWKM